MAETPVITELRDQILIVTLNRPTARNAIDASMAMGISDAMDLLDRRDDIAIGILTGAGGSFCSGMDLKSFLIYGRPSVDGKGFAGIVERPPTKVLIAAVEGYALAGGFEVALCCDLVVASLDAKFGLPEVTRGLVASAGGLMRLPRRIPHHIAMELALTGAFMSAETASKHGLVNRLSEPGKALEVAMQLARQIAANAPLSLSASKRIIVESIEWSSSEMFERQREIVMPVIGSEDAKEGAMSFAEKRRPVWRGR